ncbi:MAG TPA: TRIC cation channel family protein [Blastocatellia bacterium]|nr:TRIC cation channel family protein [Blastocatellia bacterium]
MKTGHRFKRAIQIDTDQLLLVIDLAGTFVFAAEGAIAAIAGQLDFFGIMVLSFATALGGGIIRDVLIGAIPPAALRENRYAISAFIGGAVVFFLHQFVPRVPGPLIITLDAAGLSLFAMAGTAKAIERKINSFIAVLMGTITGVGGGTVRDIFLARVPAVLQVDIYAVAAMAGAAVMVTGLKRGYSRTLMMTIGGIVCFLLRVVSVWQHWNLPRVTNP